MYSIPQRITNVFLVTDVGLAQVSCLERNEMEARKRTLEPMFSCWLSRYHQNLNKTNDKDLSNLAIPVKNQSDEKSNVKELVSNGDQFCYQRRYRSHTTCVLCQYHDRIKNLTDCIKCPRYQLQVSGFTESGKFCVAVVSLFIDHIRQ